MNARARSLAVAALLYFTVAPSAVYAHQGHGDLQMWRACDGAALDAECAFENAAHDVFRGTCRSVSEDLVCVRNRPIERASLELLATPTEAGSQGGGPFSVVLGLAAVAFMVLTFRSFSSHPAQAQEASK